MRFKGSNTTAIVFIALFSSTLAFSGGKKAGGKAAKECVEKGGTWEKKKKKCDLPKADEVQKDTAATPAPGGEPAPSEEPAPANP